MQTFPEMFIRYMPWFLNHFVLMIFFFSFKTHFSIGADIISTGQSLSGNQTIVSKGGIFEFGFFTPRNNSKNYYVGIWCKNDPFKATIWVANRDTPLSQSDSSSSELKLLEDGNLVLFKSQLQIWSTNLTSNVRNSTAALLLDNGNLILRDGSNPSNVIWQSFDHQTDLWMPGTKLVLNNITKHTQLLTSARNSEDPGSGIFSIEADPDGSSQFFLQWNKSQRYYSTGTWNGQIFNLIPEMRSSYIYNYSYVKNERETYFTYYLYDTSLLTRCVLDYSGQLKNYLWMEDTRQWILMWAQPRQPCEVYGYCGTFGICNETALPYCSCLQGFQPRWPKDWTDLGAWWGGCVRKTPLRCGSGREDTFFMMSNVKLPTHSVSLEFQNIEECKFACLRNCSCTAYAYDNRCLVWHGDILNLKKVSPDDSDGRYIHIRISDSKGKKTRRTIWIILGGIAGVPAFLGIVLVIYCKYKHRWFAVTFSDAEDSLVPFRYKDLKSVTKNFLEKLGEGGFGSVYKGILPNSIAIAVKKLECLGKGERQFRMEVSTIGLIQHVNLVRLRGFCAEGTKRLLVYDYMPNGSLDSFLFQKDSQILDWKTRYHIALGTARGLAYLHDKCRDCIIHCDIKPGNILLDAGFSPKIADFGLAKLFCRDFSRVLTTMRGTRGYLAPEWISGVAITPKADVYSYGMTLFEIISGRRNLNVSLDGMVDYFPALVVIKVLNGEEVLSLLDYRLEGNANIEELTRVCRVACWCIQDDEKERPSMGQVVQILEGVLEVGIPPIPNFLQANADKPVVNQVPEGSSCEGSSQTQSWSRSHHCSKILPLV